MKFSQIAMNHIGQNTWFIIDLVRLTLFTVPKRRFVTKVRVRYQDPSNGRFESLHRDYAFVVVVGAVLMMRTISGWASV